VTTVEGAQAEGAVTDGIVLALDGVSVHFGGIAALTDVELAVDAGDVCGLIGPNGAGKTTTMAMLLGLVAPSGGSGTVLGKRLDDRPLRRARILRLIDQYVVDTAVELIEHPGGGLVLAQHGERAAEPPADVAILAISLGASLLRWLAGLDEDRPAGRLRLVHGSGGAADAGH